MSYSDGDHDVNHRCDSGEYNQTDQPILLTVQPDGQYTSTVLDEVSKNCAVGPITFGTINLPCQGSYTTFISLDSLIPDGDEGELVSWHLGLGTQSSPHIAHVTTSGVNLYSPPDLTYEMVLGEDGVAFGGGFQKVFAFDVSSLSTLWSYQAPSGSSARIVASAAGNGLAAKVTNGSNVDTIVRLDSSGTPSADNWSNPRLSFASRSMWLGMEPTELASFAATPVQWALSAFPSPPVPESALAAEPPLRLAAQSDYENTGGRHVLYWLLTPGGALANDRPYTVFEYQTDLTLAEPYGQSPRDYRSPVDPDIAKFDDTISSQIFVHNSKQMFAFGVPGERRFVVKRLERKLAIGYSRLSIPVLNLHIAPGQQAKINGHAAPYMGPWGSSYPVE